jgi:selenocysteine lyase/cysteine desulfurase
MSSHLARSPNSNVLSTVPSVFSELACQREAFSIPATVHYLDCAYMAPLSRAVEAAGVQALLRKRLPTALPPEEFFAGPNRLREVFAQLVNITNPHRVAIVSSVSYAMATAAMNLPTARGQNVVVIGDEFPSAVLPWRRLVRERGLTLRTVLPEPGPARGARWNEMLCDAIDADTAVVVLSHVHWSDGTMFDLIQIADRARSVGAAVVVDGTQSVGALPFDVAAVQPDLLVCAGYKWLMGGYGVSVAYFGPRFDGGQPLEDVWTGQLGSDEFSHLAAYRDAYRPGAERYDGGERASFMLVPMLCEAIREIISWEANNIQQYCAALIDPWLDDLDEYGVYIEDRAYRSAHLFGLRFSRKRDVRAIASALSARKVHVSVRGQAIRVSPHVYNDAEDMAALFGALRS